jgi:hypothetical protein
MAEKSDPYSVSTTTQEANAPPQYDMETSHHEVESPHYEVQSALTEVVSEKPIVVPREQVQVETSSFMSSDKLI